MGRRINTEELAYVEKLRERGTLHPNLRDLGTEIDDIWIDYYRQGGMIIAVVSESPMKERMPAIGVSKHNGGDWKLGVPFSEEIGQRLAFLRAISAVRAAQPI